jgi:hypothetical protein
MTDSDVPEPVVTVTGYDHGQQVRWFWTAKAATYPASAPLTADARGVLVVGYLNDLPVGWVDAAVRAHERLKADPEADLGGMATHQPTGVPNGPLAPARPDAVEKGR